MPIYDYACDKCGHEFEVEQRITEDPVKTCPACRARKVKRLISKTSFVLKGSGWYSDLYSSTGAKKDAGADKAEGASGDAKPDAKPEKSSDAKPEPKADAKPDKAKSPGGKTGAKGSKAA